MASYAGLPIEVSIDYRAAAASVLALTQSRSNFDDGSFKTFSRNLEDLHSMVVIEGERVPRTTRTEINKLLRRLNADKGSIKRILDEPFVTEVLNKALLDFNAVNTAADSDYDYLHKRRDRLNELVLHLRSRIAEFDQLGPDEQTEWAAKAKSKREIITRNMLYSYLQRGKPVSVETKAVRVITQLYEFVTGKPFAVTPLECDKRDRRRERYSGPGIRFACSVVRALSLTGYFSFDRAEDLHRHLSRKNKAIMGARRRDRKLEKHYALYEANTSSDSLVASKIGDAWDNDKRRVSIRRKSGDI